jgi:hypothetical protein
LETKEQRRAYVTKVLLSNHEVKRASVQRMETLKSNGVQFNGLQFKEWQINIWIKWLELQPDLRSYIAFEKPMNRVIIDIDSPANHNTPSSRQPTPSNPSESSQPNPAKRQRRDCTESDVFNNIQESIRNGVTSIAKIHEYLNSLPLTLESRGEPLNDSSIDDGKDSLMDEPLINSEHSSIDDVLKSQSIQNAPPQSPDLPADQSFPLLDHEPGSPPDGSSPIYNQLSNSIDEQNPIWNSDDIDLSLFKEDIESIAEAEQDDGEMDEIVKEETIQDQSYHFTKDDDRSDVDTEDLFMRDYLGGSEETDLELPTVTELEFDPREFGELGPEDLPENLRKLREVTPQDSCPTVDEVFMLARSIPVLEDIPTLEPDAVGIRTGALEIQ